MSETYQSKQERRQRLREALPAGLREHVSLRNVEAAAALSPQAQTRLLEAVHAGLKRLPRAIEQLRADADTSLADLLDPPSLPVLEPAPQQIPPTPRQEIADLIQGCFPDMPRVSAQALAEAEVMELPGRIAQVHQELLRSSRLKTDFVMLTVYGLMRQTLEELEDIIDDTPALREAFDQGNTPWKCRHPAPRGTTATPNKKEWRNE
jgi:hypothetical protein